MGFDRKYGIVTTEFGNIPGDEPVVVFRAQDRLLPAVLTVYEELCDLAGSPEGHILTTEKAYELICGWQQSHPERVRTPASSRDLGKEEQ